jgi:hypothetical protein
VIHFLAGSVKKVAFGFDSEGRFGRAMRKAIKRAKGKMQLRRV